MFCRRKSLLACHWLTGTISLFGSVETIKAFQERTDAMANDDTIKHVMKIRNVLNKSLLFALWHPDVGYMLGKPKDVLTTPSENTDERSVLQISAMMQQRYKNFLSKAKDKLTQKYGVAFAKVCFL